MNDKTNGTANATYGQIVEALKFMALSSAERVALTKVSIAEVACPPWLDDDVMAVLRETGLTKNEKIRQKDARSGDMVATDGHGNVVRVVLTERGKRCLVLGVAGKPLDLDTTNATLTKQS